MNFQLIQEVQFINYLIVRCKRSKNCRTNRKIQCFVFSTYLESCIVSVFTFSAVFFFEEKVLRKHSEQYLKFDREEVLISEVLLSLFVYLSYKKNFVNENTQAK